MNHADRELHDIRCKLMTGKSQRAPCSRITTRTPHARTEHRKDGERRVLYLTEIETKGRSFAHHTSAV